jgi:hypothetical protein
MPQRMPAKTRRAAVPITQGIQAFFFLLGWKDDLFSPSAGLGGISLWEASGRVVARMSVAGLVFGRPLYGNSTRSGPDFIGRQDFQGGYHLAHAGIAVLRLFGQGFQQHFLDGLRKVVYIPSWAQQGFSRLLEQHRRRGVGHIRFTPGHSLAEHQSERTRVLKRAGLPRLLFGTMYSGVPIPIPVLVSVTPLLASKILAMPKSVSIGSPEREIRILEVRYADRFFFAILAFLTLPISILLTLEETGHNIGERHAAFIVKGTFRLLDEGEVES